MTIVSDKILLWCYSPEVISEKRSTLSNLNHMSVAVAFIIDTGDTSRPALSHEIAQSLGGCTDRDCAEETNELRYRAIEQRSALRERLRARAEVSTSVSSVTIATIASKFGKSSGIFDEGSYIAPGSSVKSEILPIQTSIAT